LKKDPDAIKDLGKAAEKVLASEPDKINDAAGKAKDDLAEVIRHISLYLILFYFSFQRNESIKILTKILID